MKEQFDPLFHLSFKKVISFVLLLSSWYIYYFFFLSQQMFREIVDQSPVEIFIHAAKAMSLAA